MSRALVILAAAMALAVLTIPRSAAACSCVPPDLPTLFQQSDHVLRVQIVKVVESPTTRTHVARVLQSWKGCERRGTLVRLETPKSSAACGVELPPGTVWVLTGQTLAKHRIGVNLCGYHVQTKLLPPEDAAFLATRLVCCYGGCRCGDGTDPVACFVDPCQVESCPEGECVANYCGGCGAEFWTDGGPLVCTPCNRDADCASGQVCAAEGQCRTTCGGPADCPEDQYCAADHACRSDATCAEITDCSAAGNGWIHILCAGYPACDGGRCAWNCGSPWPLCKDAAGVDFGPCKMLLGWTIIDGACTLVSGCDAMGTEMFPSRAECAKMCGPPQELDWYTTCGDPVCKGWSDKGVPPCTTEAEGGVCVDMGATCDPGSFCNELLVCAAEDPKLQPGGCPISRAAAKTDIHYASDREMEALRQDLLSFRLATWRYRTQAETVPTRLGFLIDDVEPSPAIDARRDMVDLYGYLSMAVATIQVQQREIDGLRAAVATLRAEQAAPSWLERLLR